MTLDQVKAKQRFKIKIFNNDFEETLLEKLHNFGIYEEAILYKARENTTKGVIIFQIDNKEIGLRISDAQNIEVEII